MSLGLRVDLSAMPSRCELVITTFSLLVIEQRVLGVQLLMPVAFTIISMTIYGFEVIKVDLITTT